MDPNKCLLKFLAERERLVDGDVTRRTILTTQAGALEIRLGAGNCTAPRRLRWMGIRSGRCGRCQLGDLLAQRDLIPKSDLGASSAARAVRRARKLHSSHNSIALPAPVSLNRRLRGTLAGERLTQRK